MPRQPIEYVEIHKAADYFEPLFRARYVRAMKAVQKKVSINTLALSMGNVRQAADHIPKAELEKALAPLVTVIRDAVMFGGKLGAKKVQRLG